MGIVHAKRVARCDVESSDQPRKGPRTLAQSAEAPSSKGGQSEFESQECDQYATLAKLDKAPASQVGNHGFEPRRWYQSLSIPIWQRNKAENLVSPGSSPGVATNRDVV